MHDIRLARSDDEIRSTFVVMAQLRTQLAEEEYVPLVKSMQAESGYLLAYLAHGGQVHAVAGFRITRSLAWGWHAYVDDLVSDQAARSAGYGKALLAWIAKYAAARGCKQMHLDSGVQRHDAHRFYLRERMDITCYHFRRALGPQDAPP
jgi:GNAT superfamily N-acetyltransferase